MKRYDIEAAQNIVNMLKREAPEEYKRLMAQLASRSRMPMGQSETVEMEQGFWGQLWEQAKNTGFQVLDVVADYKMQEKQNKALQKQYDAAVEAEMKRQAVLAAQAQSQAMEHQNRLELGRQKQELLNAASRAKSKMNWALIAALALGGWLVFRLV